jgi:hypothetical protein
MVASRQGASSQVEMAILVSKGCLRASWAIQVQNLLDKKYWEKATRLELKSKESGLQSNGETHKLHMVRKGLKLLESLEWSKQRNLLMERNMWLQRWELRMSILQHLSPPEGDLCLVRGRACRMGLHRQRALMDRNRRNRNRNGMMENR